MHLSEQQIRLFRHNGYFCLSEVVPSQLIQILKSTLEDNFKDPIPPFYSTPEGRIVKIYDLYGRGEPFVSLAHSTHIIEPLQSLLGENIEFLRYRHNHGMLNEPGLNTPRLHRDNLQWSRATISVMVYLEEATIENGCTHVIPGSHLFPFVGTPSYPGSQGAATRMNEYSEFFHYLGQELPVPMPAGGILVFDGSLFHSVGKNVSKHNRSSIVLSYHSVDELEKQSDPQERILVCGKRIYRGWDGA